MSRNHPAGGSGPQRPARWRAIRIAVVLVALALVVGSTWWCHPVIGTALAVRDEPRPADAIVMTYSAMIRAGVDEVDHLYHAGFAPYVVLSDFPTEVIGLDTDHLQPLARRALVARGVPDEALASVEGLPTSQYQEAVGVRDLFVRRDWRSALVVATELRMRRTLATYRGVLGEQGIELIARPIPVRNVDLRRWWTTREGVSAVVNEWPRVLYYLARGRY
ncbi:MAG: YdcF family protein [Chloroflexi bacterium]|nr:YdcF family protein [Chloroflexota bacterium]